MRRGCRLSPVRVSVWRGHTVGFQPEYSQTFPYYLRDSLELEYILLYIAWLDRGFFI
jgi:hypothetical protein